MLLVLVLELLVLLPVPAPPSDSRACPVFPTRWCHWLVRPSVRPSVCSFLRPYTHTSFLYYNQLSGTIPSEIGSLSSVTIL